MNEIFPMKSSKFEISDSVKGYDKKKNSQKLTKFQRCRKAHSFQTIKDIEHKFW